eukprot:comp24385_c0_seq1/m.46657 comp24385_c0_seq1/g.46657  ORF comp24385_c0_seq1/g.46657 comp24385_c0_seq1/m.46657 type:complete len:278 (-) comp24385_c0_seq1:497-1330(-)
MAPVKFADLGKTVKDLFNKDFGFGEVKVEFNSKTSNGVELKATHTKATGSNDVAGSFEAKHTSADLSFTHKWNNKNVFTETVAYNKLADGLKAEVEATYGVADGKQGAKVNLDYAQSHLRVNIDADVLNGPAVVASAVYALEHVVLGAEGGYNVNSGAVTKTNLALGYTNNDFAVVLTSDLKKVNASLHQVVNGKLQAAAQVGFSTANNATDFAVLTAYKLDSDSSLKAKLNHNGELGLGYTSTLRPGVKLTLGLNVDSKNLAADAHKVGIALTLNA